MSQQASIRWVTKDGHVYICRMERRLSDYPWMPWAAPHVMFDGWQHHIKAHQPPRDTTIAAVASWRFLSSLSAAGFSTGNQLVPVKIIHKDFQSIFVLIVLY